LKFGLFVLELNADLLLALERVEVADQVFVQPHGQRFMVHHVLEGVIVSRHLVVDPISLREGPWHALLRNQM
jgi:hypothetical protein